MSRVVTIGKHKFPVRPFDYGEWKKFRKEVGKGDPEFNEMDYCFGKMFSKKLIDLIEKQPTPEVAKLYKAIIDETLGNKEEEKNLPTTGSGSQTESE
jgi:hypothetical protein